MNLTRPALSRGAATNILCSGIRENAAQTGATAGHRRSLETPLRPARPSWSTWPAFAALVLNLTAPLFPAVAGTTAWTVRVEEPTGIYRRTGELVRIPLEQLPGPNRQFVVTDGQGAELPWQVSGDFLLFPVSLIPGELPEYTITPTGAKLSTGFTNQVHAERIGLNRVELGNDTFRVVIDVRVPAVIEAYSLSAGPQRVVNLVETTPQSPEALHGDIHASEAATTTSRDEIGGENMGWTTLGGTGPMTKIELLETGPLHGHVRLERDGEAWDLAWDAHSPALRWKARKGFRFAAVSATPFLPFDRCLGGSEYEWPTGPDGGDPPDAQMGLRPWRQLPGGHVVLYRGDENYGALGVVALDTNLVWKGVGSCRFAGEKLDGETEVALTFPRWDAGNTVLAARAACQILRQPVLSLITDDHATPPPVRTPADRIRPGTVQTGPELQAKPFAAQRLPLSGDWELTWTEKGAGPPTQGWRTVRVPGSAHTQWLAPDQIYSTAAEWVSAKEWWYRKRFEVPESMRGQHLGLQFEATDYYADIRLNGKLLAHHEGYMDPYEIDVTNSARFGEPNELLVRVWAPVHYYWKHRSYTIKGAYGAVDQKPDDITALGITRPVWLQASGEYRIHDVAIATPLHDDGSAELAVDVDLAGTLNPESPLRWELTLRPRNFTDSQHYALSAPVDRASSHLVLPLKNPQLWWTWDHGKPNLYTLDIRLIDAADHVLDGKTLPVGIREVEKVGWQFYLNRKRLFIRGSNYYYHLYMSEMNRAAYERDLTLMLGMNINMLRLHCHFSNPELYDLADEHGLLLWQDYLEAWYPEDRAFSLRAAALYDPLIRGVRNHPSVALWTTCDEESLENYRDLTKHLAARPAFLDPQHRPVVRSTGRYGDAHVYHGWYGGSLWEYTKMTEEFVSELGATSLPNYETLIKFMPDAWPIQDHPQEWFFRRLQIPEALRAWGSPTGLTLQEYIPRTQAYVSRLFQIALERMRRLKYQPAGGIFHFHAIDIWPSVTMAAIDFDRVPTKVYDTVRRSFAPVVASLEYDQDQWATGGSFRCGIWAINDRWDPVPDARVRWSIVNSAGENVSAGEWPVSMAPDSVQRLGDVNWTATVPGDYQLRAQVVDAAGTVLSENLFEFKVTPQL